MADETMASSSTRSKDASAGAGPLRRGMLCAAVGIAGLTLGGCMTTYYAPYAYSYRTGWTYYSPTSVAGGPYAPIVVPAPPGPYYYGPLPQPRPWAR